MKSVFYAGAGIQSVLFFLNDGYLSATLACGSGVSPRTVRWGGTLLPQAVGRAMEWPESLAWESSQRPAGYPLYLLCASPSFPSIMSLAAASRSG